MRAGNAILLRTRNADDGAEAVASCLAVEERQVLEQSVFDVDEDEDSESYQLEGTEHGRIPDLKISAWSIRVRGAAI